MCQRHFRVRNSLILLLLLAALTHSHAQKTPLLDPSYYSALDAELSGEEAKRNLEFVTRLHRIRGSVDFRKATDFIAARLAEYKLEGIEQFQIPADGHTLYGTQKARMAWDAQFAELWELQNKGGTWQEGTKLADEESMPIVLAEDSESGEVTADLLDVGAGTSEKDYAGKEVRGKLILTSSGPDGVVALAVEKYGSAGIISYTQNQKTAWSKEDDNLIRWGHLGSFSKTKTFCFMISLKQARNFSQRLAQGEEIRLHAKVVAGQHPGSYDFVTAVIAGSDPKLKEEEIAFTCHLDHQRPGANDNASGSLTILEVARTLNKLIQEGKMTRPARTLRFIWSPEIEGSIALLNQRPAFASRIKADIHMDMVGGGPVTKSVFHVSRSPRSLPSFVSDVGEVIGRFMNEETYAFASGYPHQFDFVSVEGGKEPLLAVLGNFHTGSDNYVYGEGSFRIPAVYMHDWPDRYIHTNFDQAGNIDPTKLKRAGIIGAASGYFIASLNASSVPSVWEALKEQALRRAGEMIERSQLVDATEASILRSTYWNYERNVFQSIRLFSTVSDDVAAAAKGFYDQLAKTLQIVQPQGAVHGAVVYSRNADIKGPVVAFGYDYLEDHFGKEKTKALKLLSHQGLWGWDYASDYAYETLNFVDGHRSTVEIRNEVSAELGPISQDDIDQYLEALAQIDIIQVKK